MQYQSFCRAGPIAEGANRAHADCAIRPATDAICKKRVDGPDRGLHALDDSNGPAGTMRAPTLKTPRIDALDVARGFALLAMASYHFTWDLEFFGYVDAGTATQGGWKLYARAIASTFLLLAGISLALGHANGIRWSGFWRRFIMVAAAAAAISLATYFFVPNGFIFFGILHQIALGSLLGLAFLRVPPLLTLTAAVVIILLPQVFSAPVFDHPLLWWLGLAPVNPRSNDYVPVFPWFGVILVGIALAGSFLHAGIAARLARIRAGSWARPFRFAGRHSLAVYLIHQPVLIGLVWLFAQIWPATIANQESGFTASCEARCSETQPQNLCATYCACMLRNIKDADLLTQMFSGSVSETLNSRIGDFALSCSSEIEPSGGSTP